MKIIDYFKLLLIFVFSWIIAVSIRNIAYDLLTNYLQKTYGITDPLQINAILAIIALLILLLLGKPLIEVLKR